MGLFFFFSFLKILNPNIPLKQKVKELRHQQLRRGLFDVV